MLQGKCQCFSNLVYVKFRDLPEILSNTYCSTYCRQKRYAIMSDMAESDKQKQELQLIPQQEMTHICCHKSKIRTKY